MEARARTRTLREQIADTRQLLARSRALLNRPTTVTAPPPRDDISPRGEGDSTARTFAVVKELIEHVEHSAKRDAPITARLVEDIMQAIRVVADPTLLTGILLEGIAATVMERVPAQHQRERAIMLCGLLWDRISQSQPQ